MVPTPALSRYRIVEKIGEGAMGEVYRAEDTQLGRTVAIKALKTNRLPNVEDRTRFLREAQAISRIDHPNVVMLFEVIDAEDGLYLILQYVHGRTLRELMNSKQLPLHEAVAIGRDVASGLGAAHELGLVHRDIKPENVMVTPDGRAKILDFGIAHLAETTTLTLRGEVLGTPHYMAPEVLQGDAADARADIYALGAMLYEMIAHRRPFLEQTAGALYQAVLYRRPDPLSRWVPDLPPGVDALVSRAMAKRPDDRPASAKELAHELAAIDRALQVRNLATTAPRLPGLARRRLRPALWLPLLAVAALVALLVRERSPVTSAGPPRVMIAPFENATGDSTLAWLSGGIMDGLIAALGEFERVQVVPRATVASAMELFPATAAGLGQGSLLDAAREAGATYLVTGKFGPGGRAGPRSPGSTRITCEIRHASEPQRVESFSGELANLDADLFTTIESLADRLGRYLGLARKVEGAELAMGDRNRGSPAAGTASVAVAGGPFDTRSLAALQHYQSGLTAFERRDFPAATKSLEQAVAADSSLVRAYLLLAGMNPETENQMRLLGLAAKYSHGAPSPLPELVDAIWSEVYGRTDEAIARYETVLAQHPEEIFARHALGALYLRRREWLKAVAEIQAGRAQNPFDFANHPSLITAQVELGQDIEAQDLARNWHRRMPVQPTPLMFWIGLESNLGHYPEALALCDTLAQVAEGWDLPDRSSLLAELGRMRESNQVIARWAEHPGSYYSRSRPLTQRAWNDYLQGQYAPGRQLIARALAIKNDYYNHWVAGLLAAGDGDLSSAETHARTIAQVIQGPVDDTTSVEAYSMRRFYFNLQGEIASRRSDRAAAVKAHRLAVAFSGRMDHSYFGTALGKALSQAGDQVGAAGAYERVLAINPNYPFALLGLGRAARATGDTAVARRRLEQLDQVWSEADRDFSGRQELDELLHAIRSGSPPRRG